MNEQTLFFFKDLSKTAQKYAVEKALWKNVASSLMDLFFDEFSEQGYSDVMVYCSYSEKAEGMVDVHGTFGLDLIWDTIEVKLLDDGRRPDEIAALKRWVFDMDNIEVDVRVDGSVRVHMDHRAHHLTDILTRVEELICIDFAHISGVISSEKKFWDEYHREPLRVASLVERLESEGAEFLEDGTHLDDAYDEYEYEYEYEDE